MKTATLSWLPEATNFSTSLARLKAEPGTFADWVALANQNLNFLRTEQLNQALSVAFNTPPHHQLAAPAIRLAILGSSTTKHLHAGIRVAALRRGLWVDIYEPDYAQYWPELLNQSSGLHQFAPNALLFAFDARHMTNGFAPAQDAASADEATQERINHVQACWQLAQKSFDATILHQTILPVFPHLIGQNEFLLPGSPAAAVTNLNSLLRDAARQAGIHLLAIDDQAARSGIAAWHSETFWHQAKQDIVPTAAPLYGDLVMRLLAARYGRSAKCAVLDLDNTLWGGVIGDDGLDGIALGQGSAEGEAFIAFQLYLKGLAARGVILAVCSKNDEANALAVFDKHPEMLLRRSDIACFVANWQDKAANIRHIATSLNIGLDSLVFIDDNPFERHLVREALPMVAVPELPEEPALMAQCIADAGYFEALALTDEDRARGAQYQANAARSALAGSTTDMAGYLRSLDMRLICSPFDHTGLTRITQLINKTNQFNLTTRRYNEDEIRAMIDDPAIIGLQFRLTDRFGDNGMIAIVILRLSGHEALIDTWLMSCRVLGRRVEEATLAVIEAQAASRGITSLIGEYIPTAKNGMVATHYERLGFSTEAANAARFNRTIEPTDISDLPMVIETISPELLQQGSLT